MRVRPALIIFTETYPFDAGAEEMFLVPELMALKEGFEHITIVPQYLRGSRLSVPLAIEVDTTLASSRTPLGFFTKLRYALGALTSRDILKETLSGMPSSPRLLAWKSCIRRYVDAQHARDWVHEFIAQRKIDVDSTIFYTYWLGSVTEGLVLARKVARGAPRILVSRAHRGDLYEDRSVLRCLPGRGETIAGLTALFLISDHGREYVSELYPNVTKYIVSRLGVPDPRGMSKPSEDRVMRIVSCSFLRQVKRVELLFDALATLSKQFPEAAFEWTHIGGGELLPAIKQRVAVDAPGNLVCRLLGNMNNHQVISQYLTEPVDVFVNVSSSEGVPVSIMEAQSCGIPVVATAVGGTPEIVSSRVGVLLPVAPTPALIAEAIKGLMDERARGIEKRVASRDNWRENYNAAKNYADFRRTLRAMLPV
jgi:colanic acid/amylovoran biosynthesis glycosyltransferase